MFVLNEPMIRHNAGKRTRTVDFVVCLCTLTVYLASGTLAASCAPRAGTAPPSSTGGEAAPRGPTAADSSAHAPPSPHTPLISMANPEYDAVGNAEGRAPFEKMNERLQQQATALGYRPSDSVPTRVDARGQILFRRSAAQADGTDEWVLVASRAGPGPIIYPPVLPIAKSGTKHEDSDAHQQRHSTVPVCAICGKPAVGHCHLRDIDVCEEHRFFTDREGKYGRPGANWRCP
jgi:hypothetical protein